MKRIQEYPSDRMDRSYQKGLHEGGKVGRMIRNRLGLQSVRLVQKVLANEALSPLLGYRKGFCRALQILDPNED